MAFSVRLGSAGAENHAMRLRFGPAGYDGTVTGHLLCDIGTSRHVVHDAVVWDHALDDFVLGDVAALNRLAELLDLTTSLFGGTGRFLEGTVEIVLDLLRGPCWRSPSSSHGRAAGHRQWPCCCYAR